MTPHTVTMVFQDGRPVQVKADEKMTVYLAALLSKVRLQSDCLEGTCATCKARCTQGVYTLDPYSEEALSPIEAAARYVLTCQMHALSDCVVEFDYDSSLAFKTAPVTRPGRVAEVEMVSSAVARLVVVPEGDGGALAFLPGQYVHLGIPGTSEVRSYSFANPPHIADRLEFFIKVLPKGAMSEYVRDRALIGDAMPITGPYGKFYLHPPVRPIVMVAGGTGLAPMLSMFRHLVETGGTDQPIRLLYGANEPDELFALDELASFAAKGLDLTTALAVVAGGPGWTGATGFATDLLRPELVHGGDCDAYLCGPPPMIEAAQRWLAGAGVAADRIHAEKFLAS